MTLREFYAGIDGSYDEALNRLMSEKFMLRFLGKFIEGGDFAAMMEAIRAENWEDVFRYSHNLKGVCLNLELGRLARSASAIAKASLARPSAWTPMSLSIFTLIVMMFVLLLQNQ